MNKRNSFVIILLLIGLSLVFIETGVKLKNPIELESIRSQTIVYMNSNIDNPTYLSDIEYIANQSYTRYDKIRYDEVNGGGKITVKIENGAFVFKKGIWAHANSQVTYDISKYDYKYFTSFIGLNTTSSRGDGVKFSIYTSEDGKNWGTAKYEEVKLPQQEASFIKVDISEANYLRLIANEISGNASDHAVYADAKLVNNIDELFAFKSVEEYNDIIKPQYNGESDIKGELEFNLLKRELIQRVGRYTINSFYNESDDNKAVIDWLMSNQTALRYYILGGKPEGNYYNSLTELSRLYRNYKEDFNNEEVTQYGTVLGDLYTRMAVSLSLTHSKLVGLWMQSGVAENKSDSVLRYAIYKHMHKNGNLNVIAGLDIAKWFENYTIEEMRFVMNNNIDDEEILWLNAYTQQFIDAQGSVGSRLTPHPYMAYVYPNYGQALYYVEENKDYFNDLFSVPDKNNEGKKIGLWDLTYTIPGGKDNPEYTIKITRGTLDHKVYKVWMNMRNKFGTGAVCGGISKTGSNIRGVHGIPSAVIGQPGHAAIIYYTQDAEGRGYWNLDNDVSGWTYSEKGERMLLGWGNAPYSRGYSVVYMALAQEVINDNDKFEQSEKFVYLANIYKGDLEKQEAAYRKALEIQPLNINAWYELITLYNENSDKKEDNYYELTEELAESLKYFPLPMYHLTNLIKPKLTSIENSYKFTLLQTRILTEASLIPNNTTDKYYVYQPSLTRLEAKFLLGNLDSTIASFSFDGEDAGKIVLSNRFDGNGVRWDYSIDGKKTWKEVSFTADETHKFKLTKEEINALTAENDLYIHIVGVSYDEKNLYKIDIFESVGLPTTLFASDLENRLIGAVDSIEWKYNEDDNWNSYKDIEPDLTGDKTIILRRGATGTYLASNDSTTYTFTKEVVDEKRKYIPVSHLAIESVSTEAVNQQGSAIFAIDANYNTRWHSAWNGSDTERYITIRLDKPYNISAVEFVPAAGGNGKIYDGTVYGSMDGENWIIISQRKDLTYKNAATTVSQAIDNIKSFDVDVPQSVKYVKIVADRTNGNWFTARAFNLYEDTTVKIIANFMFDGASAGLISLIDSDYNDNWQYSLDGGATWKLASGNKHQLSNSEVDKITSENGIKIKLNNDANIYSIRIKESETLTIDPYINDLENRLIGLNNVSKLEWKFSDDDEWTSYSDKEPVANGNKILQVRLKSTGITLPSQAIEYHFTEDNQNGKMKYIPIEHLSIHGYSSQSIDAKRPYYAPNAIDGNPNTQWHTDFRYSIANTEAYISIKLDNPRYISGLDYLHFDETKYPYGFMKKGKVYVSEDGENWTEVYIIQDVVKDGELKHYEFDEPVYGQYVKLVIESHDNVFAAASMINLYEDVSQIAADVNIEYDVTDKTNKSVTAKLVSDYDINITNNNGSNTYIFTENGEFTFEYKDKIGEEKSITAIVNWIDKKAPTGTINYSIRDVTNEDVVAILTANEEITITNNNGSNTYTFTENGEFTFEFVDKAGNRGTATANVTWINKKAPTGTVSYSEKSHTNKDVIATLKVNDGIVITNNDGSNTYTFTENGEFTFEFVDKAGNRGTATASVDWIDKIAPCAKVEYSTKELTNKDVEVTIKEFSEEAEILNNNGKAVYTFTENGEFTFEIKDKAGNITKIKVVINNIDKVSPIATIEYSTEELTKGPVIVTLKPSEEVTVTNNNGSNTYTFTENGEFTFEFVDKAGNKGTATANVTWIENQNNQPTNKPEDNSVNTIKPNDKPEENNETTIKPNDNPNTSEDTYQNMTSNDVVVKVPNSILSKYDGVYLECKKLILSIDQKNRYGENSEIYEVSLKTKDNEEINLSDIRLTQTMVLNPNKEFDAIYNVKADDSVVKLDAKVNANNEVIFEDNGLGKYIITYKSDSSNKEEKKDNLDKQINYIPYILGGVSILIVGGTTYFVVIKRKNTKNNNIC